MEVDRRADRRTSAGLSRERGGSGDPSPYTALGVVTAIEVSCERVFGTRRRSTGRSVARRRPRPRRRATSRERLAEAGAKLLVADIDEGKRALADGARRALGHAGGGADAPRSTSTRPCALGGILDHETVPAAALPDRRGRGEQPARRRRHRRPAQRPRRPLGARLRRQRRRDHQHRRRVRARRLRPGRAPRSASAGSATRSAASSTTPSAMSATPLTAAMELARRNLAEAGATRRPRRRPSRARRAALDCARAARRAARGRSTPSGSRPSASSFSRCAPSVTAAARRSACGRVVPGARRASRRPSAQPRVERVEQPPLAVEAVGDVLVELRRRVLDDRAVAGAEQRRGPRARRPRSASRYSASCPTMNTEPSPSTASPVNATPPAT